MDSTTLDTIYQQNPWLKNNDSSLIINEKNLIPRRQLVELLDPEWDSLWTVLTGPRRAGKTTLGKCVAQQLLRQGRYSTLLYLNCDYLAVRQWLASPLFISQALDNLPLISPILFIDEVQRLESPGLLLKSIIDLQLPIKHIATGSSQLELKSKVQEHLTGRQLSSLILPLSYQEWSIEGNLEQILLYGAYPQVVQSRRKETQLSQIFDSYIQKDIIEILKIGKPDIMRQLLVLIAHSAGQLVNYNQLAIDCKVSNTTIRNYLDILEQTFVIASIKPFVGNKRDEVTKNPVYYYIDNGFRNTALRNFSPLDTRTDIGLLVENFIFQELFKFKTQYFLAIDIHYWRTKSGAEVDFIVKKNETCFVPVEVKYKNLNKPAISRSFRSFISAYQPSTAIIINRNLLTKVELNGCIVQFIPINALDKLFEIIAAMS